jgi:type II secretory pathway pseudopilin PulG
MRWHIDCGLRISDCGLKRKNPPSEIRNPKSKASAFTLVEMLVAMAITLVMMGAVVTLFASISSSVRNRRATIEMSNQLRHVRNVLQQDLQGATCPGITWQQPESNHGYIEIIEGIHSDLYPTDLTLDPALSIVPRNNNAADTNGDGKISREELEAYFQTSDSFNQSGAGLHGLGLNGLGDYDDILQLTVINKNEPFVGRVPELSTEDHQPSCVRPNIKSATSFANWNSTDTIKSNQAEVIWFAIENPEKTGDSTIDSFYGEPGMRTIYRRALLIAPWVNPYRYVDSSGPIDTFTLPDGGPFKAVPGLVRLLPKKCNLDEAIAAVIAFQDRYDLSVRLEWDLNLGRYKIMANTLGDLTKRENRFNHFFYRPVANGAKPVGREYPFAVASHGIGYTGKSANVQFVTDPESGLPSTAAKGVANLSGAVSSYSITDPGKSYAVRPFVYANKDSIEMATAQAVLNDDGQVVQVVFGPAPLWGTRRGEDVMMSDALAFDLKVYDPGAPLFATWKDPKNQSLGIDVVLTPNDPGWRGLAPKGANGAYFDPNNMNDGCGIIGKAPQPNFPFVGQGAYVDMGYGYDSNFTIDPCHVPVWPHAQAFPKPVYATNFASSSDAWFFSPRALSDVYGMPLAPGYCVYDTWSFHYENNGVNEDGFWYNSLKNKWEYMGPADTAQPPVNPAYPWRKFVDQATDGLDNDAQLGIDDALERETRPAYDKPLRGMQVYLRTYERDSRQIRQVRVNQHFMQE